MENVGQLRELGGNWAPGTPGGRGTPPAELKGWASACAETRRGRQDGLGLQPKHWAGGRDTEQRDRGEGQTVLSLAALSVWETTGANGIKQNAKHNKQTQNLRSSTLKSLGSEDSEEPRGQQRRRKPRGPGAGGREGRPRTDPPWLQPPAGAPPFVQTRPHFHSSWRQLQSEYI